MVNAELVKYFKEGVKSGNSYMSLRSNLISSGWSEIDVDEAMTIAKGGSLNNSLVSAIGPERIFIGFAIFVVLLVIISLFAMGGEKVDVTLKQSDLLEGKALNVGRDLVEVQFDDTKTETFRVLSVGVVSADVNVGEKKIKFVQNESITMDLDKDRKNDINITLMEIKGNSPIFYFRSIGKKKLVEPEHVDKEILENLTKQ